jgi:Protein of unknown function (DUF1326)
VSFRVRGAYLESCNCEAICPCRMVGGVAGGRSTYGICFGLLTWQIDEGNVDDVDVSGLNVALDCRYDDDEPGSPWTVTFHVDARGTQEQQAALADVFLERLTQLPWIRKARHLVGVRTAEIELEDGEARIGGLVRLRATRPVESDEPVACGIPGYDRAGRELYADVLRGEGYELTGNCAFASDFDYVSAEPGTPQA